MNPKFYAFLREIVFNSPLRRYLYPRHIYNFTPPQLCFLCQCIEDTKHIEGAVVEVGCAMGSTTLFINKYMDAQNIEKTYYAIDTFSGFVAEDIEFEVANRGKAKDRDLYNKTFRVNKKKWFDWTMQRHDIFRVRSIQADVNKFDLTTIGSISFALLDVDLYQPMKKALPELYQVLSPGGILVVDDCDSSISGWDGSYQAYKEFMKEIGQNLNIIHGKLGVIKK